MSFYDFFHRFFEDFHEDNFRSPGSEDQYGFNSSRNPPVWNPQDGENDARDSEPSYRDLMTEFFEMQQVFEKQFNDVFKIFSIPKEFFEHSYKSGMQPPSVPTIEGTDPRDHYLKPEYRHKNQTKVDNFEEKIDQRLAPSWLDGVFPSPSLPSKRSQPGVSSSFSSVTVKTVRLPDGSVKTEKYVLNPDGTEERMESHTLPDGSSSANLDSPFSNSGFFNLPKVPELHITIDPRDQHLKPGFEPFNPYEDMVDKDLDNQILRSGVKSLPPFSKDDANNESEQKSTYRSFVKKTVTLPNGIVESEEVVRNLDGTEQRTVTQVFPDGTTKTIPTSGSLVSGSQEHREEGTDDKANSSTLKGIKDLMVRLFK